MGLFSQDSKETNTSYDQRSEQSPIAATGKGSVAARGNILFETLGDGAQSVKIKKGGQYIVRTTVNQNSDPAVLQSVLGQILSSQGDASAASAASLEKLLSKIGDLAENKQTDGEAGRNKTILYIALAAAGALATIFGKGRWGLYITLGSVAYFLFSGGKKKAEAAT